MLCKDKWVNVGAMYKYANGIALPLLSNFDAEFWADYILNYQRYDKLFKNMYKTSRYYNQEPFEEDNTVETVTLDFVDEVYNHLLINKKKYEQLFKIYQLNDENLINDYYIEETHSGERQINSSYNSGARSDTTTENLGRQQSSTENKIMAFNSTDYVKGSKTDEDVQATTNTSTFNKGASSDTDSRDEETTSRNITKGFRENPNKAIKNYINTWNSYEFYKYIFNQIAIELLLV